MKPITRKEYYLAKAAGTYTGPTPPPVLREDYYLATLAGDYPGNCPAPVTRIEKYMSAAAGLTSYIPHPVTRVEKYWYAIAKGTGYVPEPVTREERFLYALVPNKPGPPKPEYVDKTAEGNPILLTDSAEAPLTALTVYGHSTQDGTPSPENPVPIVSAGDSGQINVNVGGKNLIPFPYLSPLGGAGTVYEADGVTYTVQADGGIKCVGTPTNIFGPTLCKIRFSEESLNTLGSATNGKVTLSGGSLYFDSNNNSTFIYWDNQIDTPVDMTIYPQVEYGIVATAYEPYKTPQTLTLSTPGGLPGIPVSSGGNYTDESGQQWICDEIDLKRGKYVQRVSKVVVDGVNVKFKDKNDSFWNLPDFTAPGIAQAAGVPYSSNYFPEYIFGGNLKYDFIFTTDENINPYFSSNDELNAFCAEKYTDGQPLEIYYPIDPIETDLPAEEIAAYKALHTYTPNTSVGNDADAWMKVGYKATT